MEAEFDIDKFQNELNAAEIYLRGEIGKTSSRILGHPGKNFRISEFNKSNNEMSSIGRNSTPKSNERNSPASNRYADPKERENLIARLLIEHGSSTKSQSSSVSSKRDSLEENIYEGYNDKLFSNLANSLRSSSRSADEYEDTLFFASDINGGTMPASGSPFHSSIRSFEPYSTLRYPLNPRHEDDNNIEDSTNIFTRKMINKSELNELSSKTDSKSTNLKSSDMPEKSMRDRKYLKTREQSMEESRNRFRQQYTFKPNIHTTLKRSKSAPHSTNRNGFSSESDGNKKVQSADMDSKTTNVAGSKHSFNIARIEAMQKSHERAIQERERRKLELDRNEVLLTCTFKPQLSKGSHAILRHKHLEESMSPTPTTPMTTTTQFPSQSRHVDGQGAMKRNIPLDVTERLYEYADQKAIQTRLLHKRIEEAKQREYSFQPEINPGTTSYFESSVEYRPIYDRVGELQREQALNKQILMESIENEKSSQMTFAPEINDTTKRIISSKIDRSNPSRHSRDDANLQSSDSRWGGEDAEYPVDVCERLTKEGRRLANRKLRLLEEHEKVLEQQMTSNKISKGSEIIARTNPEIRDTDILERQAIHVERVTTRNNDRRFEEELKYNNWFKPDIVEKSKEIVSSAHPERNLETPEEKFHRLSKIDAENIDLNRQRREEEIYGNITFVPDIDQVSRALGRPSSIEELMNNRKGKRIKENIRRVVESKLSEECTFTPQITKSKQSFQQIFEEKENSSNTWRSGCPLMGMYDDGLDGGYVTRYQDEDPYGRINLKEPERMARNIRLHLQAKEEKRREALIAKELEELQGCTFHPKIDAKVPKATHQPVVVRGIGRHFELRNMHYRQKDDDIKRVEDAFRVKNVEKYRCPETHSTEVQPFALSESRKTKSRAVQEMEQEEESNLTFYPATVDKSRRQSVRRIASLRSRKQ